MRELTGIGEPAWAGLVDPATGEGSDAVWKQYWGLSVDPFYAPGTPYVATSGHDEAIARLVESIESTQRLTILEAGEGLGKSLIVSLALRETRHPSRRFARVTAPVDGPEMLATLAHGLGASVPPDASRSVAWRALVQGVRLCRLQNLHTVLVVEDAHFLIENADRRDLDRLVHLDSSTGASVTVIQSSLDMGSPLRPVLPFPCEARADLAVWLPPLTRSETGRYLNAKLAWAGRAEAAFAPRAIGTVHEIAGGVPRVLNRLGSLALMAGAVRGREIVTPDLLADVASECRSHPYEPAA